MHGGGTPIYKVMMRDGLVSSAFFPAVMERESLMERGVGSCIFRLFLWLT